MPSSSSVLPSLKDEEPRQAERLLADLVQTLLPQPTEEQTPESLWRRNSQYLRVLNDVKDRLRVDPWDASYETRQKLLNVLSTQLARLALPDETRARNAKSRLGAQGRLPNRQYRITFNPHFNEAARDKLIKRSHVESALLDPDAIQHLVPEKIRSSGDWPAVSLYVKRHIERRTGDAYSLLVVTDRKQDVQEVTTAWRVYPSLVDLSEVKTPLDVLRRFVDAYGMQFVVGSDPTPKKFVFYESFPATSEKDRVRVLSGQRVGSGTTEIQLVVRYHAPASTLEVALAYAIDVTRHVADLQNRARQ